MLIKVRKGKLKKKKSYQRQKKGEAGQNDKQVSKWINTNFQTIVSGGPVLISGNTGDDLHLLS